MLRSWPFEVSDDEAVKLLLAKHNTMKPEEAQEAVRSITGGRLHLLYIFPTSISIDEYRSNLFMKTNTDFINASLSPTHPFFAHLFSSASKCIACDTAAALLNQAQLSKLLEKNILSLQADGDYAFNSRHVETFFDGECCWLVFFRFFCCQVFACIWFDYSILLLCAGVFGSMPKQELIALLNPTAGLTHTVDLRSALSEPAVNTQGQGVNGAWKTQ